MAQYNEELATYTTHKIKVDRQLCKVEALDIVLDYLATWVSAENFGDHSDSTLGEWTLEWSHATDEERQGNIWVYAIECDEPDNENYGNIVDVYFTFGDTLTKMPESNLNDIALTTEQQSIVSLAKDISSLINGKVECDFENNYLIFDDFTSCCDSEDEMWNELMAMKTGIELYIKGGKK